MTHSNSPQTCTTCNSSICRCGALTRRAFLGTAISLALGSMVPSRVFATPTNGRTLSFFNIHTAERLEFFHIPGQCSTKIVKKLNYFLRDFRTGAIHTIDKRLLDSLCLIAKRCGKEASYQVISGYRSPKTNAMLHRRSSGVATHSLHMEGKAIDVRLNNVPISTLRDIALAHHNGGVGYYPQSGFVHLDTGRKRSW